MSLLLLGPSALRKTTLIGAASSTFAVDPINLDGGFGQKVQVPGRGVPADVLDRSIRQVNAHAGMAPQRVPVAQLPPELG